MVVVLAHGGVFDRRPKARPARAGIELGVGRKQRRAAAHAVEHAFAFLAVERVRERAFGAVLARDVILLGRELSLPLIVGLRNFQRAIGIHGGEPREAIIREAGG